MELDRYLDLLRDDLMAAAALGDEDTRRAANLLTTALAPAARLTLISALADFASEVSALLGDTVVDVTMQGRDVRIGVRDADAPVGGDWTATAATEPLADSLDDEADIGRAMREAGDELSRTTLRLVNRLKAQAEHLATSQGVSLNTYIQRAVADAVRSAGRRARRNAPAADPRSAADDRTTDREPPD